MVYKLARKIWKFTRWITGLFILFLIAYAANVAIVQVKDIPTTAFVSLVNWLFLPRINRTLTLSIFIPLFIITLLSGVIVATEKLAETSNPFLSSQNRQRLLAKVRSFWINGVLNQSLQALSPITLELHDQPDALANPWDIQLNQVGILSPDITQIYDEAGGELLILGEPGSGKTTLLLELTENLLDRAKDDDQWIPIVFQLSSWTIKRQSLADWLIEELHTKYQVRLSIAETLVQTDKLLPLLDGLDEVATIYRASCINAINLYKREHLAPIVVCSRRTDYLNQKEHLLLRRAIVIQPLTIKQIDKYFMDAGEQLTTVHEAFQDDVTIRKLLTTPLMLSILIFAYQGISVEDILSEKTRETRRQQLFATYVQRMLQRRTSRIHFTIKQTIDWLAWFAMQLKRHGQNLFYVENIQPDWLLDNQSQLQQSRVVNVLFSKSSAALISIILGTLVGFLFSIFFYPIIGWFIGFLTCILWFLLLFRIVDIAAETGDHNSIEHMKVVVWSWAMTREVLFEFKSGIGGRGVIAGFTIALLATFRVLLSGLYSLGLTMVLGLLFLIVAVGLTTGLTTKNTDKQRSNVPNRATWKSLQNGIIWGLTTGLASGIPIGIALGVNSNWLIGLIIGLTFGLVYGLSSMLIYGGIAWIMHFVLRLHLWRLGYIPFRYVHFLNYAADCSLIHKVGGGFTIHSELRDYLAKLTDTQPSPKNSSGEILVKSLTSQEATIQKQAKPAVKLSSAKQISRRRRKKRN